ncbi:MAG: FAD-dependent oxidoreductase [Deltaproteobacteria bacterium]|nr:MAG: FAD-dependent oxidoreductase [Deltaproteobacteria bacterium]
MTDGWTHKQGDRRRVVVIGAGVAGMTAAHELVERGYEVEVVEMAPDLHDSKRPRLGGMARTAWARVPSPRFQAPLRFRSAELVRPMPRAGAGGSPVQIKTDIAPLSIVVPLLDALEKKPVVAAFVAALRPGEPLLVITSRPLGGNEEEQLKLVLEHPFQLTVAQTSAADEGEATAAGEATGAGTSGPVPRIQISVAGARVPGEHGFRFFPSFYHHLFDTMKRIPIAEAAIGTSAKAVVDDVTLTTDSARSVFDALLSNDVIQLGLNPDGKRARSFEIPRRPMHRLITRYTEYLTSSSERRRKYEQQSWAEFLGLDDGGFSPVFAAHVSAGAQALVAMSSETNDARTIGSIAMQLTLDQIRPNPGGYVDATLRGPTSIELFEPWRAYLESESVVFTRGQLVGFCGHGMVVRPVFGCPHEPNPEDGFDVVPIDPADYYVITIPVDKFQGLFRPDGQPMARWRSPATAPTLIDREALRRANEQCLRLDRLERGYPPDPPGERSDDIAKLLGFDTGDVAAAPDDGPLRYMCGIQFYFESDVKVFLGHTLCLDSPWGVSYISQSQYWQDRSRGQSGIRGIISAIFTRFEVKAADRNGQDAKPALACNPDEVADRVWTQIRDSWDEERFGKLPDPDYYYIDESLHFDGQGWSNATPYLVNQVKTWQDRGGLRVDSGDYVYRMQLGHTVFAGAFMRTYTRLNTMEAANESGRRATNAILGYDRDHDRAPLQCAQIWNLEDHELPEVSALRELDRRIARRGGGHVLRHAGVEAALRGIPWDLVRLLLPTGKEDR